MPVRPLAPLRLSDWHGHLPASNSAARDFWEWWYFEIDFDYRGDPWKIITVLHFPHAVDPRRVLSRLGYKDFDKYPRHGRFYAGVTSYVVCDRTNEALLITRAHLDDLASVTKRGDLDVRIGNLGRFRRIGTDRYRLTVAHDGVERDVLASENRSLRLELDAVFTVHTPGFRPKDALIIDGGAQKVHWACPMPNPRVELRHLMVREGSAHHVPPTALPKIRVTGGYHDHQWGDGPLERHIADWSWGRITIPRAGQDVPDRLIFFGGRNISEFPRGALQDPAVVLARGDGTASYALDPDGSRPPLRLTKRRRWPARPLLAQGIHYYRTLEVAGRDLDGTRLHYRITHRASNNVDTWPFYLRFVPEAETLAGPPGCPDRVDAVSEYARWSRLRMQKPKWLLAQSDTVNVEATPS